MFSWWVWRNNLPPTGQQNLRLLKKCNLLMANFILPSPPNFILKQNILYHTEGFCSLAKFSGISSPVISHSGLLSWVRQSWSQWGKTAQKIWRAVYYWRTRDSSTSLVMHFFLFIPGFYDAKSNDSEKRDGRSLADHSWRKPYWEEIARGKVEFWYQLIWIPPVHCHHVKKKTTATHYMVCVCSVWDSDSSLG